MISSDFAPNERFDDGLAALRILFQPWIWRRGTALTRIKIKIESYFPGSRSFLFLTGRAALYHVLQALTLKRGDEVVVVGFTCEAVVLPITALGLKPVYVDIEPDTFGPNVDDVQKKITKRTRVLILQHTFGIVPSHRAKLLEIAKKNDMTVIEDLAHGFAPGYFKKETEDTIKLLSFGRSKAISSVFGGAIVTNDDNLITRLKSIEKRLAQPSFFFLIRAIKYKLLALIIRWTYDIFIGKALHFILSATDILTREITTREKEGRFDGYFNKVYPNALAYLGIHQFKKFEQIQDSRSSIVAYYNGAISKKLERARLARGKNPLIRYPVLIDNRDEVLAAFAKKNIFLGRWYDQPVGPNGLDLGRVGYRRGSCPVAESVCDKIINLPTYISLRQAKRIVNLLDELTTTNYSPLSKKLKKKAAKRKSK